MPLQEEGDTASCSPVDLTAPSSPFRPDPTQDLLPPTVVGDETDLNEWLTAPLDGGSTAGSVSACSSSPSTPAKRNPPWAAPSSTRAHSSTGASTPDGVSSPSRPAAAGQPTRTAAAAAPPSNVAHTDTTSMTHAHSTTSFTSSATPATISSAEPESINAAARRMGVLRAYEFQGKHALFGWGARYLPNTQPAWELDASAVPLPTALDTTAMRRYEMGMQTNPRWKTIQDVPPPPGYRWATVEEEAAVVPLLSQTRQQQQQPSLPKPLSFSLTGSIPPLYGVPSGSLWRLSATPSDAQEGGGWQVGRREGGGSDHHHNSGNTSTSVRWRAWERLVVQEE